MNQDLNKILDKCLNGEASESERELVDSWYQSFETNPGLMDQLSPEEAAKAMVESFVLLSKKLIVHKKQSNKKVI